MLGFYHPLREILRSIAMTWTFPSKNPVLLRVSCRFLRSPGLTWTDPARCKATYFDFLFFPMAMSTPRLERCSANAAAIFAVAAGENEHKMEHAMMFHHIESYEPLILFAFTGMIPISGFRIIYIRTIGIIKPTDHQITFHQVWTVLV